MALNVGELEAVLKLRDDLTPKIADVQKSVAGLEGPVDGLGQHAEHLGEMLKGAFEHPEDAIKSFATSVGSEAMEGVMALAGSLGPLGIGIGVVTAGLVAVGTPLYELGQHATEVSAELEKVALTTSQTVAEVGALKFAFEATGGSLEQVGRLMFMFQQRMENSSDTVDKGLKLIGLSLDELSNLRPDQQILAISEAMQHAGADTNLAAAAMDIFGRQGRDALPQLLQPLGELAAKQRELGGVTEEAARAAHEFEIAHATMATETSLAWTQLGNAVAPITQALSLGFERMKLAVANVALAVGDVISGFGYFSAAWSAFSGNIGELPKVNTSVKGFADMSGLAAKGLKDWNDAIKERGNLAATFGSAIDVERDAVADLNEKHKVLEKQYRDGIKAQQDYALALQDLTERENGYQGVLDSLGDTVVAAIRYDLEHKATVEDVARVYGVSRVQVEILKEALTEYGRIVKEVQKIEDEKNAFSLKGLEDLNKAQAKANKQEMDDTVRSINETQKLWIDYYDEIDRATMSSTEYKKAKVKEWFDNEVLKLKEDDQNWLAHYNALYATAQQRMADIEKASNPYFQDMKKLLSDLEGGPGGWDETFATILTKTGSFKDAAKGVFDLLKTDVEKIFADMLLHVLQGFFAPLEAKLGSLIAQLSGLGGGGGGWLSWLTGLIPGGGGAGSTPITGGYFDANGNWIPTGNESGGGLGGGTGGDGNPNHEARGGVIYASRGRLVNMAPYGSDTVPAMLTPGERVLSVAENRAFESSQNDRLDTLNETMKDVLSELQHLPDVIKLGLTDALQKAI